MTLARCSRRASSAVALATGLALAVLLLPTAPASADHPEPVVSSATVGDPSVVAVGKQVVVVATGPQVSRAVKAPGRRWRWTEPALSRRPAWARRGGEIWAADIAKVGRRWLLYYSVPVKGLGEHGRCIGVAVGRGPLKAFRPIGSRPLVCPSQARVPLAADPMAVPDLPVTGAIDPSLFRVGGASYLLYKTDGRPSSIRLLPLNGKGRRVRAGLDPAQPSVELVRSADVIENPVLTRRADGYYLFASEGDFARCTYHQTWRRSLSLTDWTAATQGTLLDTASTGGLCGPAGGDLLERKGRTTIWFHGWVKRGTTTPKGPGFWGWGGPHNGLRALYAARLRFVGGVPTVVRFLR